MSAYASCISQKRPSGGSPINKLSEAMAALVMVRSCAACLQKNGCFAEYHATLLWMHDDIWRVLGDIAALSSLPHFVAHEADLLVEYIRAMKNNKEAQKIEEQGDVWMLSAMTMLLDDVGVALRDPAKIVLVQPIIDAGFSVQMGVADSAGFFDVHKRAEQFVHEIYGRMAGFKMRKKRKGKKK